MVIDATLVGLKKGSQVFGSRHVGERGLRASFKSVDAYQETVVDDGVLFEEITIRFDLIH